jgi:EAL domain-containing protein (putative c-di-GMP-specific phosphodiesterase class I)
MDDLAVEEHSLLLLREQLGAVQHIRRELERKDAQISNLKVQLTEAQSFRDQAISLRAQCRILEERMSLLVRD